MASSLGFVFVFVYLCANKRMSAKKLLKAARVAIKEERFEDAIQICKEILDEEPAHYDAMVYTGAACVPTAFPLFVFSPIPQF
jgi:hypothetical protein